MKKIGKAVLASAIALGGLGTGAIADIPGFSAEKASAAVFESNHGNFTVDSWYNYYTLTNDDYFIFTVKNTDSYPMTVTISGYARSLEDRTETSNSYSQKTALLQPGQSEVVKIPFTAFNNFIGDYYFSASASIQAPNYNFDNLSSMGTIYLRN